MTKIIKIDRKVVEWKYRALFGMTKITWVLVPIEVVVKDPKTQKGAIRRLARRRA